MSYLQYRTTVKALDYKLCCSVYFVQNDRSLMVFASSLNVAEVEQVFTQEEGKIVNRHTQEEGKIVNRPNQEESKNVNRPNPRS
jgi:hypothetical protein